MLPAFRPVLTAILCLSCFLVGASALAAATVAEDEEHFEQLITSTSLFDLRQELAQMEDHRAARFLRFLPGTKREDLYVLAVEALHSDRPQVVEAGINALERIRVPLLMQNLHVIRERLHHHNARIRWVAARLIGTLKDDLALESLIRLLDDEPKVARAAHDALVAITHVDKGTSRSNWTAWMQEWLQAEQTYIPNLASKLDSEDEGDVLRSMGMLLLLKSHRHTVGELLAEQADHPSPQVRGLVINGLRALGGVAALKSPEAAGRSITEVLAEIEAIEQNRGPGTKPVLDSEEESEGLHTSQVVTIVVMLVLLLGGATWLVMWSKKNPTRIRHMTGRVKKAAGEQTKRIAKNLKRITFSE